MWWQAFSSIWLSWASCLQHILAHSSNRIYQWAFSSEIRGRSDPGTLTLPDHFTPCHQTANTSAGHVLLAASLFGLFNTSFVCQIMGAAPRLKLQLTLFN